MRGDAAQSHRLGRRRLARSMWCRDQAPQAEVSTEPPGQRIAEVHRLPCASTVCLYPLKPTTSVDQPRDPGDDEHLTSAGGHHAPPPMRVSACQG